LEFKLNIKILNYGIGNLGSIVKLLNSFDNINVEIADDKNDLKSSDLLILPGVGTFPSAIKNLQKKKLFTFLKKNIKDGLPVLGICLGMHILSKGSDELGYNEGLSFFSGNVIKIPNFNCNVGWNDVLDNKHRKFGNFYFQHSFFLKKKSKDEIAKFTYVDNLKIISYLNKKNIFGVQFHPEKSQIDGYMFFENFLKQI